MGGALRPDGLADGFPKPKRSTQTESGYTVPVRSRTDLAWGIEITPEGHLELQTFSPEVLRQNAADLVTRGDAGLWDDDLGRLLADVRQYRENAVTGRPGHTGLTGDALAKSDVLQTLTGLRIDDAGDANPPPATATRAPTPAVGSLRLDRINKLFVAEPPTAPSTAPAYEHTATNFRPDEPDSGRNRPRDARTRLPSFGRYLRKHRGPPPPDMYDPHAHHIIPQKGNGPAQQALVQEGHALLRRFGIDPIMGLENLVCAPWRVKEQHGPAALKYAVDELKRIEAAGGSRADIVETLEELGNIAAQRGKL